MAEPARRVHHAVHAAGAMAPVTLAGALAQQHAEALAGIALAQIVRPGAPVMYGGFTSNVDMKSRRAGLRHARVHARPRQIERPARAPHRRAVPLEQRDGRQLRRRAGRLRERRCRCGAP